MTATNIPAVRKIGAGLKRPECVLTHATGFLFASDWNERGAVSVVSPQGTVRRLAAADKTISLRPNGIALEAGGSVLVAHLGNETGGLFRLYPDGHCETVLADIAGELLPPSNFPLLDSQGRIWLTVSTRKVPRAADYRYDAKSGFIVLIDDKGARVAADGLGYTNEMCISPDGRHAFVNETFGRRLTRFAIAADGSLSDRHVIWSFGPGDFPDGLCLDAQGHFWVTSIVSNRVIRIAPDGSTAQIILEDLDNAHVEAAETAFRANAMGRPHLDQQPAPTLKNISSLAFGGPGLRTAYLGNLLGDAIPVFETDVAGQRPVHFDFDISPLLDHLDFP